jgi:hypothetical protein
VSELCDVVFDFQKNLWVHRYAKAEFDVRR